MTRRPRNARWRFAPSILLLAGGTLAGGFQPAAARSPEGAPAADVGATGAAVLARINGEELYAEDLEQLLGEIHSGAQAADRARFDLDRLAFRLVNDALLAQEARALGMAEEEPIPRRLRELRERLATRRLWSEEMPSGFEVDAAEIESVYAEVFRTVTVRILTRRDRGEADELLARVRAGEDLESLARETSQDPYRSRGGLVKDAPRIDLPEALAEAVFAAEPGALGGPVANPLGWTVFRVEELREADPEMLDRRRGALGRIILGRREREERRALADRLRRLHAVEIDEAAVEGVGWQRMDDGRLVPRIEDPEAVVATIGNRAVRARELGGTLTGLWGSIVLPEVALALKPQALEALILEELVAAEAERRGHLETPEVERAVRALERNLLVGRYLDEVLGQGIEVTREEAEAYYAERREAFRRPPRLDVSQITLASREEGERIAELARAGADFAWLARQHSTDRFREDGGRRGSMPANQALEEFSRELARAEAGDVFGPKGAADSWRVLKVTGVTDQGFYAFEEVSGNVRARLADARLTERLDALIGKLRERSEIWIDEDALAALRVTAAPAGHGGAGHGGG